MVGGFAFAYVSKSRFGSASLKPRTYAFSTYPMTFEFAMAQDGPRLIPLVPDWPTDCLADMGASP